MKSHYFQNARCHPYLSPLAGRGRIASAIRVRGSLREGAGNCFKHARQITEYLIVPKSKRSIIVIGQPFVAGCVGDTPRVLPSIHFDDEATFPTNEVHGVGPNRLLPDKLAPVQLSRAQLGPKRSFRIRRGSSKASGTGRPGLISRTHVEAPPHPDCCAIRPLPASGERLASNAPA